MSILEEIIPILVLKWYFNEEYLDEEYLDDKEFEENRDE